MASRHSKPITMSGKTKKWKVVGELDNIQIVQEKDLGEGDIQDHGVARVGCWSHEYPDYHEAEENAHLMSASPDLLKALTELTDFLKFNHPEEGRKYDDDSHEELTAEAEAAIRKANNQNP